MSTLSRLSLALVGFAALLLAGCQSLSDDAAPGGIKASETGMNTQSIQQWQDQTVKRLAY